MPVLRAGLRAIGAAGVPPALRVPIFAARFSAAPANEASERGGKVSARRASVCSGDALRARDELFGDNKMRLDRSADLRKGSARQDNAGQRVHLTRKAPPKVGLAFR
jgi:hypothetical protein